MDLTPRDRFTGNFRHTMDAKNRVTVPARWRAEPLEELFALELRSQKLLKLMPKDERERLGQVFLQDPSILPAKARRLRRSLFGMTVECPLDKQGRLVLPQPLIEKAGLGRDVVLVGVGELIEVWDPSRWTEAETDHRDEFEAMCEEVGV